MSSVNMGVQLSRKEAARGKNVLIVCCGVDLSKSSIFRRVKSNLEINLYCLESPDNRMAIQLDEEGIWTHIPCREIQSIRPNDGSYIDSISKQVTNAIEKYNLTAFDGCATIWDDAVGLCARIADKFKLPGNSCEAIDTAHDKYLTRQRLVQCGLPCPLNVLVKAGTSDDEIVHMTKELSMPVIVKPASAGSSIGVRKVSDASELIKEYQICLDVIKHALSDGELMGINMGDGAATDIIIEEFLEGSEVDVDVILRDGEVMYKQVMDDWPFKSPWFCELGCHFPSKHPDEIRKEFIQAAEAVVKAIGLTTSVHHLEFIYDKKKGPTLVEANPRMGGGPVYNFHLGAFGVDLLEEVIFACLGLNIIDRDQPYPGEGPSHAMASCVTKVAHARKSGVIQNDVYEALESARNDPDVILAADMSRKGDHVTGWEDGFPSDMARIDVVSASLSISECLEKVDKHINDFFSKLIIE